MGSAVVAVVNVTVGVTVICAPETNRSFDRCAVVAGVSTGAAVAMSIGSVVICCAAIMLLS